MTFGLIISVSTTYINYIFKYDEIKSRIVEDSISIAENIEEKIKFYLHNVEDSLDSVATNDLFINYLIDTSENTKYSANHLFLNVMRNNDNFFQFRFLDANGMEKIRIGKSSNTHEVFLQDENKLQNKSERYYFTETIGKNVNDFWYSDLDLNIENNEIEKPLRPTLRISKNIFYKGKFYGILILNVEMESLLNDISKNTKFDIFLVDKDGNFKINPDENKNWSKYLNSKYTIYNEFPIIKEDENTFFYSLEKYFNNNEKMDLILKLKKDYYNNLYKNNLETVITIAILIILLSLIIALLISYPTSKIYINFNKLYRDNLRYLGIIDKYVIIIKYDIKGICTDASKRFTEISGYSKQEIIGKKFSILKSKNMSRKIYKDLWRTINKGFIWIGELENETKSGESYWIEITIIPDIVDKKVISYTSISRNITDKKRIEKISEIDKLTQIYNRTKLDKSLEFAMNNYNRYKQAFTVIIIDVDFFKDVNDNYGHLVGDAVLVEISNLLENNIRETDIFGRWGGEEFMIICTNTNLNGTVQLSEKLRKIVEEFEFSIVKHKTISIGISEIKSSDNILTLLKRVDKNLYKSKENGRNKVSID